MLPTPSGTGFAIFVLIWFLLLLVGFVAITLGLGRLVDRHLLDGPGYLVGALTAAGWIWLVTRLDDIGLVSYALLFLGVPAAVSFVAVHDGRRRG